MPAAPEPAAPRDDGPKFETALARLEETERRIEVLTQDDGELRAQPFKWEEDPG